jgi:photosystem II stability/assembly factor-like uncharacterized protein
VNVTPNGYFFASGGAYIERSVDQGSTWQEVTDLFDFTGGAIAYAPSNPTTMIAGRGYGTLKSVDGGSNWFHLVDFNDGRPARAITFQPDNELTVYAGCPDGWGLYKSTDGGATWKNPLPMSDVSAVAIDPLNPQVLYVGSHGYSQYPSGIMKSADAGTTWNSILPNTEINSIIVDPANSQQIYAGTGDGSIYKSTNGGTTWTKITGSPIVAPVSALAFDPQNSSHLFAATSGQGVFNSLDRGATWSADNQGLTDLNVVAMAVQTGSPYRVLAATYGGKAFWATVPLSSSMATHFTVSPSVSSTTAGAPFSLTVTALDANNKIVTGYTGKVHFTSSDGQAVLPNDYTFVSGDAGVHTFTNQVILKTTGSQTVTGSDTVTSSITDTTGTIMVISHAAATRYTVSPSVRSTTAGNGFNVTVIAVDDYGNTDTDYTGTVLLTSSDRYPRPTDYTFTRGDNGQHVFNVSLFTAGVQTLLARDAAKGSISGSATVTVYAATADHFLITASSTAVPGIPFDVIVTALDPYGNTDTTYQGAVTFTTSDSGPGVVLPPPYTFATGHTGDNGVHVFLAGVTLITPGDQVLTIADATNVTIVGGATITVLTPAPPPRGGASSPPTGISESSLAWTVQLNPPVAPVDRLFALLIQEDSDVSSKHFPRVR